MPRSYNDIINEMLDRHLEEQREQNSQLFNNRGPMEGNPGEMMEPGVMMGDPRIIDDLMFNPTPMTKADPLPRPAVPLDPTDPGGKFDDSMTKGQQRRNSDARTEAYVYGPMPLLNPHHYNNPPSFQEDQPDAARGTYLQRMYDEMPQKLPRYPMMEMPAPDQSPEMSQLMQFYSQENI